MGVGAPPLASLLEMGTIGRPHGVRGELTFWPFSQTGVSGLGPRDWGSFWVKQDSGLENFRVETARPAGDHWLIRLANVASREAAAKLTQCRVLVPRAALPPLAEGEYYIADTIGLEVRDQKGDALGSVTSTFWNGAQDVAIVQGADGQETLLPLVDVVVKHVDISRRLMEVEWDVEEADEGPEAET